MIAGFGEKGSIQQLLRLYFVLWFLLLVPNESRGQNNPPQGFSSQSVHFFEKEIRPLLHRHCLGCHSEEKRSSGLSLQTREDILRGGHRGPAALVGDAAHSRMIEAVEHAGELKMPRDADRLRSKEIQSLRRWVDMGLPWPQDASQVVRTTHSDHWAFQSIQRTLLPHVKDNSWIRNPIDHFILARLEREGLKPSPEADPITLIRRLSLDLLGLPPTPEEVDTFVLDSRPDAYKRLVDRLLASSHYGERWGRHWLDVARYADTNGFGFDRPRVMWRYRDWVINALNQDMPFDQFVIEQLAGDLIPGTTLEQKIATGYHRNTMINEEGGVDKEQYRVEAVIDRISTTGTAFLGLTVGCAQCHDHKFDPISQREFYQLFAFFNDQDEHTIDVVQPQEVNRFRQLSSDFKLEQLRLESDVARRETELVGAMAKWETSLGEVERRELPPNVRKIIALPVKQRTLSQAQDLEKFFKDQDLVYQQRRKALQFWTRTPRKNNPNQFSAMILREREDPRKTHILIGGDFLNPGVEVVPGVPFILPPLKTDGNSNRLDLARWLVSGENPLTARVTVNRIWQRYFGRGLVSTPEDFGTQGEKPSHPELLDWLSSEFMNRGWSLKAQHRLIVTSATYRQSSRSTNHLRTLDPNNVLLARSPRYRVQAETVRDIVLTAGGLIHHRIGGPSVFPPQPPGITDLSRGNLIWVTETAAERYRRGMYTFWKRTSPYPSLILFDSPTADETAVFRERTNTPLQALVTLNDPLFVEAAQGLATIILQRGPEDDEALLEYGFRRCVSRKPDGSEREFLMRFLRKEQDRFQENPQLARALLPRSGSKDFKPWQFAAWFSLARVLLNLDETITRE